MRPCCVMHAVLHIHACLREISRFVFVAPINACIYARSPTSLGLSATQDLVSDFAVQSFKGFPKVALTKQHGINHSNDNGCRTSTHRVWLIIRHRPLPSASPLCCNKRKGVNLLRSRDIVRMWQRMAYDFPRDRIPLVWIRIVRLLLHKAFTPQLHQKSKTLIWLKSKKSTGH